MESAEKKYIVGYEVIKEIAYGSQGKVSHVRKDVHH
jgi:hypothetical protein